MKSFNENFNTTAWLIDTALTLLNKWVRNSVEFMYIRRSQTKNPTQWVMADFYWYYRYLYFGICSKVELLVPNAGCSVYPTKIPVVLSASFP